MFLLILTAWFSEYHFLHFALNSIMFLLIRFYKLPWPNPHNSLNSIMFLLIHNVLWFFYLILPCFKFHYVSINSPIDDNTKELLLKPLNSIMFLLIQVMPAIQYPAPNGFKFHYVSINSHSRCRKANEKFL